MGGGALKEEGEGEGEILYIYILSLDCHHQNDSCVKMGSDESPFNVSFRLIVSRGTKSQDSVHKPRPF